MCCLAWNDDNKAHPTLPWTIVTLPQLGKPCTERRAMWTTEHDTEWLSAAAEQPRWCHAVKISVRMLWWLCVRRTNASDATAEEKRTGIGTHQYAGSGPHLNNTTGGNTHNAPTWCFCIELASLWCSDPLFQRQAGYFEISLTGRPRAK